MRSTSASEGPRELRRPLWRSFALALVGLLLLEAAWALVVPPFQGLDEYGHAIKAAAVARGDWHAIHEGDADGGFMAVPRDLADAARPVCLSLLNTPDHHCVVEPTDQPGTVRLASSASSYNPVFYFLIGTPARAFSGGWALYAMRATAALLCALLLAGGFAAGVGWSRSRVVPAAALLAITPVTLYSCMVAAPNGIELAGAFAVWMALLGIARAPVADPLVHRYLALATAGAVPLALVRGLGPVWLALIVLTRRLLIPWRQIRYVLTSQRGLMSVAVASAATVANLAWSHVAHTNTVNANGNPRHGMWADLPRQWFLWFFQSVDVAPGRVDFAPLSVYVLVMAGWLGLSVGSWLVMTRRERLCLGLIFALSTLVAAAITIETYAGSGPIWQGRYGYPYAIGFLLICGYAVDRHLGSRRLSGALLAVVGLVVGASELVALVHVLDRQRIVSPLAGSSTWVTPSTALVVGLVCAATASLVLAGWQGPHRHRDPQPAVLPPTRVAAET